MSDLSPVVAAALAEGEGDREESFARAEFDRIVHFSGSDGVPKLELSDGELLAYRASGLSVGEEFSVTRELRKRNRNRILFGVVKSKEGRL